MKKLLKCAAALGLALSICYGQAGNYNGVCVGINDYPGTYNDLMWCVADAQGMKYELKASEGWTDGNITLKLNGDATEQAIKNAIDAMPRSSGYTDLFHFSGHGYYDGLFAVDETYLSPSELQTTFGTSYSQYASYLDACHSGVFPRDMSKGVISSACTVDEAAGESDNLQHGVFSYYLIAGLNNRAAGGGDGIVTAEELHGYAAPRTTNYNPDQHPQLGDYYSGDLVLDPAPAAPQNVSISGSVGEHPTISWSANSEGDLAGYKVYRKVIPDESQFSLVATVSQTSWTDIYVTIRTGGTEGQYAYYYVKAYDAANNVSNASATVYKPVNYIPPGVFGDNLKETILMNPEEFGLSQNYPNPFNPETEITFALPEPSSVRITVSDILGRDVLTLNEGEMLAGFHRVRWNGQDAAGQQVSSGIYIYRITAVGKSGQQFTGVRKMLLTR